MIIAPWGYTWALTGASDGRTPLAVDGFLLIWVHASAPALGPNREPIGNDGNPLTNSNNKFTANLVVTGSTWDQPLTIPLSLYEVNYFASLSSQTLTVPGTLEWYINFFSWPQDQDVYPIQFSLYPNSADGTVVPFRVKMLSPLTPSVGSPQAIEGPSKAGAPAVIGTATFYVPDPGQLGPGNFYLFQNFFNNFIYAVPTVEINYSS
jgi:hypothetical protein